MNIIIAPIHETLFAGRGWMGLDFDKIKEDIELKNFNYKVTIINFFDAMNDFSLIPVDSIFIYSVSKNNNYLHYIKDCVLNLSKFRKDVVLLPNIDQLYSYENKGYQELVKKRLYINNLKGKYFGDIDDYLNQSIKQETPFVHKEILGAGSIGVKLIKDNNDLRKIAKKNNKIHAFIEGIRKYINIKYRLEKDYKGLKPIKKYAILNFDKFRAERSQFVIQDFIPGLKYDFKILIFGDKFYALKRAVKKNDFRASASGMFEKVTPPIEVLDYAYEIQRVLKVPFVALDIGISENKSVFLFEFESIGFGPLTLTDSTSFFIKKDKSWDEIIKESNLEEEYANAIHYYITTMLILGN